MALENLELRFGVTSGLNHEDVVTVARRMSSERCNRSGSRVLEAFPHGLTLHLGALIIEAYSATIVPGHVWRCDEATETSSELRTLIREIATDFRSCWKRLFLADVVYKVISFVVLTPLVAGMFHVLMAFAGNSVLADQDILFFFMKPSGWICLIVVGGLSLRVAE